MATNPKKKAGKEGEKRSAKKGEETVLTDDKKDEFQLDDQEASQQEEATPIPETPVPREPTPEPVYEEPVLTLLIVESYEGEKDRGLYEGEGEAQFMGGHKYKGLFHEGLMHGQGTYTWNDGLVYEGEFTSNRVSGKGIYTWPDGSVYDGEVLSGLRHGFGTFRCANGRLSYTGEWNMAKRHGKGRMDYDSEGVSFYEGDWIENERHGWGTRRYPSGNIYQGMWFHNMRHGDGNMRWLDRDQMYNGQWENGIQHGLGQHIWFLKRVAGSQYPLRNMYDGELVQGLRDGYGAFFYANGAKYEGAWTHNMKHGKGKFVFKNGRIYEGLFERDHIVEFPDFQMDGVSTPDLTQIRTRTPLPSDAGSVRSNESRNTYSPSFQLEVDHVLQEFAEEERPEEATQVLFVIMRYMTGLRKIYNFYSSLGYDESPDNTFVMTRMQFWRLLKDAKLHHQETTLAEMDRYLSVGKNVDEIHNPYGKVLFRDFNNYLIVLAYRIYGEQCEGCGPVLASCLCQLITQNILKHACSVKGYIYHELRRAVNALVHTDQTYDIYQQFNYPRKMGLQENSMKMRDFLFMIKDLKLINDDLTPKAIIDILAHNDPKVADNEGACNLELEITFLEFFEALVGCAQAYVTEAVVKDPSTPRPSTSLTHEHSYLSVPASRMASQVGGEDGEVGRAESEACSPNPRSASQMTGKTGSTKHVDPHASNSSAAAVSDVQVSQHPHSAKRSEVTVGRAEKSTSFMSVRSDGGRDGHCTPDSTAQSVAEDHLEGGDYHEFAVDELDEATRQFNFWTHQLHIFFVRKFFPAAQKLLYLKQLVRERYANVPAPAQPDASRPQTATSERADSETEGRGFEPVIEEEEEPHNAPVPPIPVST